MGSTVTEVDDRLKELNDELAATRLEIKSFAAADGPMKIDPENRQNISISAEHTAQLRKLVERGEEVKSQIVLLESAKGLSGFQNEAPGSGLAGADAAANHEQKALQDAAALRARSLGEMFSSQDTVKSYIREGKASIVGVSAGMELNFPNIGRLWLPRGQHEAKMLLSAIDQLERKDVFTAAGGTFTSPAFGSQQDEGLIIPAYRTQRVRDLFPTATTTSNMIEFIRRTGYTNNAQVVPERTAADGHSAATGLSTDVFGLKPPSNLVFTTEQAAVRVIAHTIDVSKTVLDDEPRLQDTINGEMLYGLRLAEDAELLFGDGTGAHVLGIMNTNGVQVYDGATGPTSDYKSDQIRRSLTLVMLAYYESTGVVMHPFDWEDTELEKDQIGQYVIVTNVTVGAQQTLWRNPVIATPAMQQGQWLAGAFGLGAKLWDREQANIAISTETRDLFERNAICIRAEERVALEVGRPESFVKGSFR